VKIQEDRNIPQDIADIIIPIILEFVFVLNANGIIHDATNNTHAIVIVNPCAVITVCFYFMYYVNLYIHGTLRAVLYRNN
jgi:hypothetical protein